MWIPGRCNRSQADPADEAVSDDHQPILLDRHPTAEMRNPLQKQHIEMNMAQRGPLLSTLLPNRGMDE